MAKAVAITESERRERAGAQPERVVVKVPFDSMERARAFARGPHSGRRTVIKSGDTIERWEDHKRVGSERVPAGGRTASYVEDRNRGGDYPSNEWRKAEHYRPREHNQRRCGTCSSWLPGGEEEKRFGKCSRFDNAKVVDNYTCDAFTPR